MISILFLILGICIGSFLNVVIARLPHDQSIIRPRSHCPKCKKPIQWYDNLPLISFAWLKGRCRNCKTPISFQYPFVETITGLLFLAAYRKTGLDWVLIVRDLPILASWIAIVFIDLEHRIIPDELNFGGLVLALALSAFDPSLGIVQALFGTALGFGLFYTLAWGYEKMSGQAGLGGGDIKLLAALGAFLGPLGVLNILVTSSIVGSVIGILWAIADKTQNRKNKTDLLKTAIPFGPFLIFGALTYYLYGDLLWFRFMTPM